MVNHGHRKGKRKAFALLFSNGHSFLYLPELSC